MNDMAEREMTLDELVARLHENHTARRELAALRESAPKPEAQVAGSMRRLRKFVDALEAKPMRGVDDEFYSIHVGTEWEASLSFSDLRALSTPASHDAQQPVREEMSPDFTDSARAAIAWVLYHHQGGSSPVGQPLRFALGMGAAEQLPDWRIAEAKAWAAWANATTADFHAQQPAVVGDGASGNNFLYGIVLDEVASALVAAGISILPAGYIETLASEVVRRYMGDAALTPAATPGDGSAQ